MSNLTSKAQTLQDLESFKLLIAASSPGFPKEFAFTDRIRTHSVPVNYARKLTSDLIFGRTIIDTSKMSPRKASGHYTLPALVRRLLGYLKECDR